MRDTAAGGGAGPRAGDLRTHRPPWAPVVAGAWLVVAALLLADLVRRGDGADLRQGLLALGATVPVAWVLGLAPRLTELPDGVEVVNPLRRVRLRWADLRDVVPRDVLVLVTDAGDVRCAGVVGRGRSAEAGRAATRLVFPSARDQDLGEPADAGSSPRAVADRLEARRAAAASGSAPGGGGRSPAPRLAWHLPSLALLVLSAALGVGAVLL